MPYTKSQAAAQVAAGKHLETFHHVTLGIFNVTLARQMIQKYSSKFPVYRVRFDHIKADGHDDFTPEQVVEWLIGQREVCPVRVAELAQEQLEDPAINLYDDDGMVYTIDGIHRLAARFQRGYEDYPFYALPLKLAPRLEDPNMWRPIPWGEKEIVGGDLVKVR